MLRPVKLVIVDDHAMVREGLRQLLNMEDDFRIIGEAEHGDEVVEKVLTLKPDVVLMDINLPGKNGIELTGELRRKAPAIKVLALSADGDQYHLSQMIKAGAAGYILKDVNSETLCEAIKTVAKGEAYLPPQLLSVVLDEFRQASLMEQKVALPDELGLTPRELEIIGYIACGENNKEIAEKLFISEKTVKNHVSNILRKMNLEDRTQVAVYAYQKGLVAK
jgi:DNA-binding NarL/FixJ family response regulator